MCGSARTLKSHQICISQVAETGMRYEAGDSQLSIQISKRFQKLPLRSTMLVHIPQTTKTFISKHKVEISSIVLTLRSTEHIYK